MKKSDLKIMAEEERKELQDRYIRFDWAIKRLLRQKANFDVLNGFLTVMLREEVRILEILESEGNQESAKQRTAKTKSSSSKSRTPVKFIISNVFSTAWPKPSLSISRWVKAIRK